MQEQVAEGAMASTEHLAEDATPASTADAGTSPPTESVADGSRLQGVSLSSSSSEKVSELPAAPSVAVHPQPFALFKQLWSSQGWCWFHFKVFDGRARESFLSVVLRLFSGIVSVITVLLQKFGRLYASCLSILSSHACVILCRLIRTPSRCVPAASRLVNHWGMRAGNGSVAEAGEESSTHFQ